MTEKVDVSVIVATFGTEEWKWRGQAVAYSIDRQTVAPLEVIAYHGENLAEARNSAALKAQGTWLLFLDADDSLHKDYLKHMAPHLRRKNTLLTSAIQFILPEGPQRPRCFRPKPLREGNYLPIGTLVTRDLFFRVGGFDPKYRAYEEWPVWMRCVELGAAIQRVPYAIYQAYWRPDSRNNTVEDAEGLKREIVADFDEWKASL